MQTIASGTRFTTNVGPLRTIGNVHEIPEGTLGTVSDELPDAGEDWYMAIFILDFEEGV